MNSELTELQKRHERLNLLYQVSNVIHSSLDPREALELIVGEAVRLMRAASGSVVLINPTNGFLEIEASSGLPQNAATLKLRVGEGITGWVARFGKPVRVGDVTKDSRYIMVRTHVRSELAVPLELNGEVRGVLNVDADRENAFNQEDEELLQALALQAAKVIHNTWLYEQVRLKARLLEGLVHVGQTINSTLNLDDALKVITREACTLMDGKMCSILLVDHTREWLDLRASHGAGPSYLSKPRLSVAESFVGVVVRRKKPLQLENVQISARYQNANVARSEGLVSLLSVPLIFNLQALGVLSVYTGQPHSFSNEEVRILSTLASLSAISIEKARLYERIVDLEEHLRQSEKLSAIGLLAAEVAHEIRNPLTVMKMLFHSLDLRFPKTDARARDVQIIADKMDHLNKIVEQTLDYARTNEPSVTAVNINNLIDDLGLLIRHKLINLHIELVRHLDPALPLVMADAIQLEQIFLNLALNAVEAMTEGGKLTVSTGVVQRRRRNELMNFVLIRFKDTGYGMTEEERLRAFSSLLSSSKPRGTGFGIAIVRKVVDGHHGELKIQTRSGGGTTISVFLPVEPSCVGTPTNYD